MSKSRFDYDVVDPAGEQTVSMYSVAQWHNGQQALKVSGGVQFAGGVVLPVRYLSGEHALSNWKKERITFRSGKEEDALTSQKAVIAPVRTRFRWFTKQGADLVFYPRNAYVAGAHMRGHLQVLAAVQDSDHAVVITFKGKASQVFESLLKDFTAKVVQPANREAPEGRSLPRYAFWMTVVPGPHTKAGNSGQESVVTLPTLTLPDEITPEYLRSVYVGRDNLIRYQDWNRQAASWADAWEKTGDAHGCGTVEDE